MCVFVVFEYCDFLFVLVVWVGFCNKIIEIGFYGIGFYDVVCDWDFKFINVVDCGVVVVDE